MPREPSAVNTNSPGARGDEARLLGSRRTVARRGRRRAPAPIAQRHRADRAAAGPGSPSASRRGRRARRAHRSGGGRPRRAREALEVGAVVVAAQCRIVVVLVRGRAEPGRAVERRQQVAGAGDRQAQRRGRRPARGRDRRWSGRDGDAAARCCRRAGERLAGVGEHDGARRREHVAPSRRGAASGPPRGGARRPRGRGGPQRARRRVEHRPAPGRADRPSRRREEPGRRGDGDAGEAARAVARRAART